MANFDFECSSSALECTPRTFQLAACAGLARVVDRSLFHARSTGPTSRSGFLPSSAPVLALEQRGARECKPIESRSSVVESLELIHVWGSSISRSPVTFTHVRGRTLQTILQRAMCLVQESEAFSRRTDFVIEACL